MKYFRLWSTEEALKFEFYIIFTCHKYFPFFFQSFKNTKIILSSRAVILPTPDLNAKDYGDRPNSELEGVSSSFCAKESRRCEGNRWKAMAIECFTRKTLFSLHPSHPATLRRRFYEQRAFCPVNNIVFVQKCIARPGCLSITGNDIPRSRRCWQLCTTLLTRRFFFLGWQKKIGGRTNASTGALLVSFFISTRQEKKLLKFAADRRQLG